MLPVKYYTLIWNYWGSISYSYSSDSSKEILISMRVKIQIFDLRQKVLFPLLKTTELHGFSSRTLDYLLNSPLVKDSE